ncbi:M2 family metallopeptidase [Paenibacillus chitinolyticus]|uniref:M2 family metallopeptidase n=1 Tax=Paenibacillus chitinolyticus TaxID=79263 RepID=UPI002DBF9EAC|nr:M2 family metallopeptidase [Paenibacillus chitinolyticus]MEC0246740.1 M2 family metallopeptidase [Paenibacillus chitinolyticus]
MSENRMSKIAGDFLNETNERLQKKYASMMHALWMVMMTGDMQWAERCAEDETAYQDALAEDGLFEQAASLGSGGAEILTPLQNRQLEVLRSEMLEFHTSRELRTSITAKWNELHYKISTFRAEVDGRKLPEHDILKQLAASTDSGQSRRHWTASMRLGGEVAPGLIELVKLRNRAARQNGHRNYYEMKMAAQELEPAFVESMIRDIRHALDKSYRAVKAELDDEICVRFGIDREEIRPWHYDHPFAQKCAWQGGDIPELDSAYFRRRLHDFFRDRWPEAGSVLSQADLMSREMKSQANCCLHIDRAGDIRVSCGLAPSLEGIAVLLHELGHAFYETGLREDLPFLLRQPAHTCLTEGVALLFERLTYMPSWLKFAGLERVYYGQAADLHRHDLRSMLLKLYWTMTFIEFERRLYENPARHLNKLWWELVEEIQGIRRPDEWDYPYWAAKAHFTTLPVYYVNYLLGEAAASQVEQTLRDRFGTWYSEEAFACLSRELCSPGQSRHWNELLEQFCGEKLQAKYLARELQAVANFYVTTSLDFDKRGMPR